jgi:hypothetical protein
MIIYNDGTTLNSTNLERPRTDVRTSGSIGILNGEVALALNGETTATIDMRTAAFSGTITIQGTIDGTNYITLSAFNPLTELWITTFTAAGQWVLPNIAGFKSIRCIATSYTSGAATVTLNASIGKTASILKPIPANLTGTAVGTSGAAVTLTISSGGAGLYHYLCYLRIDRFAVALLTAGATPVTVTTTNISGSIAFSLPADAAAQGTIYTQEISPSNPIKSTTAGTNTTIVCPATTNVIWRVTAVYYVSA